MTATPRALLERLDPGKSRDFFIKGSLLQMEGHYAEAILELQQALRYDNSPVIYFAIGSNYKELAKPELAIENFRIAISMDSSFWDAYEELGEIYISQFQVDSALTIFGYLQTKQPSLQTKFTLARLYEFRDVPKAITLYNQILEETDDYTVLARLNELYTRQGRTDKAIEVLERLNAVAPDNPALPPLLMQSYIENKRYAEAVHHLITIEHTVPSQDIARYYTSLGNALAQDADSSSEAAQYAGQFLHRTDSILTDNWQVQLVSGLLAGAMHDTASERFFGRALALADTIKEVPLQIGVHYLQHNSSGKLVSLMQRYEMKFPDDPRFPFFSALGLSRLDSNAPAITALLRALAIDSSYTDAWVQLGIIYSQMDEADKSDAAYQKALVLEPDNPLANNNYAYSLSERGMDLVKARKMTEVALKAEPNNPSYLDTMGWIYYQLGDYSKALEYIQKAIDNGDVSAAIYEHLGDVYHKMQNHEKALEAWKLSLSKDPGRNSIKQRLENK